jgi:hypothetical protein
MTEEKNIQRMRGPTNRAEQLQSLIGAITTSVEQMDYSQVDTDILTTSSPLRTQQKVFVEEQTGHICIVTVTALI